MAHLLPPEHVRQVIKLEWAYIDLIVTQMSPYEDSLIFISEVSKAV